jgi:hypothetical protein
MQVNGSSPLIRRGISLPEPGDSPGRQAPGAGLGSLMSTGDLLVGRREFWLAHGLHGDVEDERSRASMPRLVIRPTGERRSLSKSIDLYRNLMRPFQNRNRGAVVSPDSWWKQPTQNSDSPAPRVLAVGWRMRDVAAGSSQPRPSHGPA